MKPKSLVVTLLHTRARPARRALDAAAVVAARALPHEVANGKYIDLPSALRRLGLRPRMLDPFDLGQAELERYPLRPRALETVGRALIGQVVNFDVQLSGFADKCSYVRWSLFRAKTRTRVSQPWLVNRDALYVVSEADVDRASGGFWVPLPRMKGPLLTRAELFDDRGVRLDFADTRPFR